jgi:aspartyl-tRNA(Asn)/glutamyl-tRNA(Gln) amidotransferase subunit A
MIASRREWITSLARALAGAAWAARREAAALQATEPTAWSVAEMRRRLDSGDVSPLDLVDAHLERIERMNPELNAYVTIDAARARDRASRLNADRSRARRSSSGLALFGVPLAHKDLFETAGIRTTAGSKLYDGLVPGADAALVASLAAAGGITLGKTNTHELGGGVTTINPFYGATRNPRDRTRIPGGSSGGSAAAVAAHLCAAATGSDTGGSVRIPAAFCGCVGFKPTFGLLSTRGLLGASPTFDHVGLLARTVEDVEVVFDAARGVAASPLQPAGPTVTRGRSGSGAPLRIGVARRFFFDDLEVDVARAMDDALARLRAAGANVRDRDLPIDERTMARVFDPIVVAEIWDTLGPAWKARPDVFSPGFARFFKTPRPGAPELAAAHRARRQFQVEMHRAFGDVDVFVMPTVPITAPPIDGPIDGMRVLRHTWAFNAARTPAMSVPCGVDRQGLPVGLQIVGRPGEDATVLRAGRAFEGGR